MANEVIDIKNCITLPKPLSVETTDGGLLYLSFDKTWQETEEDYKTSSLEYLRDSIFKLDRSKKSPTYGEYKLSVEYISSIIEAYKSIDPNGVLNKQLADMGIESLTGTSAAQLTQRILNFICKHCHPKHYYTYLNKQANDHYGERIYQKHKFSFDVGLNYYSTDKFQSLKFPLCVKYDYYTIYNATTTLLINNKITIKSYLDAMSIIEKGSQKQAILLAMHGYAEEKELHSYYGYFKDRANTSKSKEFQITFINNKQYGELQVAHENQTEPPVFTISKHLKSKIDAAREAGILKRNNTSSTESGRDAYMITEDFDDVEQEVKQNTVTDQENLDSKQSNSKCGDVSQSESDFTAITFKNTFRNKSITYPHLLDSDDKISSILEIAPANFEWDEYSVRIIPKKEYQRLQRELIKKSLG